MKTFDTCGHLGKCPHAYLPPSSPIMTEEKTRQSPPYTCKEYREEMILLALQQQLHQPHLTAEERQKLLAEIALLTKKIGL